jgi:hypothetical protein
MEIRVTTGIEREIRGPALVHFRRVPQDDVEVG